MLVQVLAIDLGGAVIEAAHAFLIGLAARFMEDHRPGLAAIQSEIPESLAHPPHLDGRDGAETQHEGHGPKTETPEIIAPRLRHDKMGELENGYGGEIEDTLEAGEKGHAEDQTDERGGGGTRVRPAA